MNIFLHELKAYRKSTVIWTLSLAALIVFFLSMFPGLTQDADQFKKPLENYPEAAGTARGGFSGSSTALSGLYS